MLEVKNLIAGYGKKIVLKDVSFGLTSGDFCGVIGPNGSGKSTLLRALTRVVKPSSGLILWNGKDSCLIDPVDLARQIAVVSQIPPLYPITVSDFVMLGRTPFRSRLQFWETRKDREAGEHAMRVTDVEKLKDRTLDQLSGGERQLVMIARAIAQEPKVLLLDEPTSHLDISHQVRVLDLLRRMNRQLGLTVVMVLHDLNLASEYAEKLLLISEGRVHTIGTPDEVLNYRAIEEVYKTMVVVRQNPISKKPCVFLVSEDVRSRNKIQ